MIVYQRVGKYTVRPMDGTLLETNIAPKNGWLEYYFPIGEAYFQGLLLLVSGRVLDGDFQKRCPAVSPAALRTVPFIPEEKKLPAESSVLPEIFWSHLGVSKNRGRTPKMDGL